jgi:hypothetical protein
MTSFPFAGWPHFAAAAYWTSAAAAASDVHALEASLYLAAKIICDLLWF